MAVSANRKRAIGDVLAGRGAAKPCARCGHLKFTIVDEVLIPLHPLSRDKGSIEEGVPAVMVCCDNCGNLWHHALKAIDLMPASLQERSE